MEAILFLLVVALFCWSVGTIVSLPSKRRWRAVRNVLDARQPVADEEYSKSFTSEKAQLAVKVRKIIAGELQVNSEVVRADDSFTKDLALDDAYQDARMFLILRLEKELGVHIPDEVANNLTTVGDLVVFVDEQIRLAGSGSSSQKHIMLERA